MRNNGTKSAAKPWAGIAAGLFLVFVLFVIGVVGVAEHSERAGEFG